MKTVLITGVGKGIGKALTGRFLRDSFFVVGTYYTKEPDLKNENLALFQLDLTKPKSIETCIRQVSQLGKKIDILINNAGVLLDEEETKVVDEKLRATLEVNLIGAINFTEQMIPFLISGSHIVNISSSAGSLELPAIHDHSPYHYPAYKISKVALNMYTRTLVNRFQNEKLDITVSSVHPGWVKTDMGGEDADMTPQEAVEHIFKLATSKVETGQFWFKGEKFPW